MTTAQDIITDSLNILGVYAAGETISDADLEQAFTRLNDMLDSWSNESLTCFAILELSSRVTRSAPEATSTLPGPSASTMSPAPLTSRTATATTTRWQWSRGRPGT